MSDQAQFFCPFGSHLLESDYRNLEARWVSREFTDAACLRRVDSYTAREMFGRKSGDLAGIVIPYAAAGENRIVEYRLRVDHPELEYKDGKPRETRKYIQPPGRRNRLYFPPGVSTAILNDPAIPVIVIRR